MQTIYISPIHSNNIINWWSISLHFKN